MVYIQLTNNIYIIGNNLLLLFGQIWNILIYVINSINSFLN